MQRPTITIVNEYNYAYIVPGDCPEDILIRAVDEVTSYKTTSYSFLRHRSPNNRHQYTTKTHYLLDKKKLQFPAGLLPQVQESLEAVGFTVHTEAVPLPQVGERVIELEGVTLRPYQYKAVEAGLGLNRGVICLPPGAGKTEVAISLVASLEVYPVLWLTHRALLAEQTIERFQKRLPDLEIGSFKGGKLVVGEVVVAIVQSLTSKTQKGRLDKLLEDYKVVVVDECHHVPSSTIYNILMKCRAPLRYGLSATPTGRGDKKDVLLTAAIGKLLCKVMPEELENYLNLPDVVFVEYVSEEGYLEEHIKDNWRKIYKVGIVESKQRNTTILELCKKCIQEDKATLVLVNEINHGQWLEREITRWLEDNAYHAFLWSSSPPNIRNEVIQAFKKKEIKLLISSPILDEGGDIPEIDTIIVASAGKGKIKNLQRIGRGFRQGGSRLKVFDFYDSSHKTLLKHSKTRQRDYKNYCALSVSKRSLQQALEWI